MLPRVEPVIEVQRPHVLFVSAENISKIMDTI